MIKRIPYNKDKITPNKIHKKEDHCLIELNTKTKGIAGYTKIDYADLEKVIKFRWCLSRARKGRKSDRVNTNYKGKTFYLHNVIMDYQKNIDHINQDALDNRRENLRIADYTLQNINKQIQKNNTSGVRGVIYHPKTIAGKLYPYWEASIRIDKKNIFLGCFLKKEDAIVARKEAEKKYFEQYKPNIIPTPTVRTK